MIYLQVDYNGRETLKAMQSAVRLKIPYMYGRACNCPKNWVPVGCVDFCEEVLGQTVRPDFYPDFLNSYFNRYIYEGQNTIVEPGKFVKPSEQYKMYPPFVTEKHFAPYYGCHVSDIVKFTQEWRYYVSWGEVMTTGWYAGEYENMPAPVLPDIFPKSYCGAVDFGLVDGILTLVEAQHPYACGHYSDDHEIYLKWLIEGWKYTRETL